jgi:hypothetical protein
MSHGITRDEMEFIVLDKNDLVNEHVKHGERYIIKDEFNNFYDVHFITNEGEYWYICSGKTIDQAIDRFISEVN